MVENLKLVIITGSELRHRYFASHLSKYFAINICFFEKKANVHEKRDFGEGNSIVKDHFAARTKSEHQYFGEPEKLVADRILEIETGTINNEDNVSLIIDANPDFIVLFGSSLVKTPILDAFPDRIINLHLGLSPYYRGSGTNFWPMIHGKPELVGATIHLATTEVDAGSILHQVRPVPSPTDNIHDFGNKTIIAATEVLPEVIFKYHQKKLKAVSQDLSIGVVCKRKDLTAESITLMNEKIENGMIRDYFNNMETRQKAYPIINNL